MHPTEYALEERKAQFRDYATNKMILWAAFQFRAFVLSANVLRTSLVATWPRAKLPIAPWLPVWEKDPATGQPWVLDEKQVLNRVVQLHAEDRMLNLIFALHAVSKGMYRTKDQFALEPDWWLSALPTNDFDENCRLWRWDRELYGFVRYCPQFKEGKIVYDDGHMPMLMNVFSRVFQLVEQKSIPNPLISTAYSMRKYANFIWNNGKMDLDRLLVLSPSNAIELQYLAQVMSACMTRSKSAWFDESQLLKKYGK